MFKKKLRWFFPTALSILLIPMLATCSPSSSDTSTPATGRVTSEILTDSIETSGTLEAKQIAALTWSTSGIVVDVNVSSQDKVTAGEELLRLDPTTAPAEVLNAVSELVTATQELEDLQLSKTGLAEAYQTLVDAKIAFEDAREQYLMLDDPIAPEDFTASLKLDYSNAQKATERALRAYNQYGDNPESYDDESYYPKFAAYAALCQARIDEADALTRLTHFSNPPTQVLADKTTGEYNLAKENLALAQKAYDEIAAGNLDALTAAQAAVDAAQATVNKLSIIAPFDGEVAVVYSQAGDSVTNGTEALVLVDRSTLYVDVLVEEASITEVKTGDPAAVTFQALGIEATGIVEFIDPIGVSSNNVVNYTVRVKLNEQDPEILVGSTAKVLITTAEPHEVLFVPVSAVLMDEGGEYVMRVTQNGTAERVSVVTGDIADGKVQVVGNLTPGELIQLTASSTAESSDSTTDDRRGGLFGMGRVIR